MMPIRYLIAMQRHRTRRSPGSSRHAPGEVDREAPDASGSMHERSRSAGGSEGDGGLGGHGGGGRGPGGGGGGGQLEPVGDEGGHRPRGGGGQHPEGGGGAPRGRRAGGGG